MRAPACDHGIMHLKKFNPTIEHEFEAALTKRSQYKIFSNRLMTNRKFAALLQKRVCLSDLNKTDISGFIRFKGIYTWPSIVFKSDFSISRTIIRIPEKITAITTHQYVYKTLFQLSSFTPLYVYMKSRFFLLVFLVT